MKILFTGATGVVGLAAIPELLAAGHEVAGVARTDAAEARLASMGAAPVRVDLFDRSAVAAAVFEMDAVAHFATAIPAFADMRKRQAWFDNDRLRGEATSHLVDASIDCGVGLFVQESVTFAYGDGGERWITEESPLRPVSPVLHSALEAERHVERFASAGGRGVSLRLSRLYGPGRASEETVAAVLGRKAPIVGDGSNYVSSLHVDDAARALVASLGLGTGAYNVTDDAPVHADAYTRSLAHALGAPSPRRVPAWLAKPATGVMFPVLTVSHRVSNDRFTAETGWRPSFPAVTDGWRSVAGDRSV